MVEFALVTPLLLLLLFGVIEFGLGMYRLQSVHAASRDAARIGALPTITSAEVEARALASLGAALLAQSPTIRIEPDTATPCESADQIVVTVEVDNPMIMPLWDELDVTLSSRSEFACER